MSKYADRLKRHWHDSINVVLGIWLIASPWMLGYAAQAYPSWNAYIVGVIIAVAASAALVAFQKWEEWVNAGFGAWLLVSPWVLGYSSLQPALWNQLIVGGAVAALALWSAFSDHGRKMFKARN